MFTSDKINCSSQLSAISRLFSAGVLKELSNMGRSPLLIRLLDETGLRNNYNPSDPISEIFDDAFAILKKRNNRHEYIYKSALTHKILLGTHSLKTASMINEFRIADCKADTVILNGTGTVYEIKSERDSLKRLVKQVSTYRQVFAKVNVITGENHLNSVLLCVPDDVGVLTLSNRLNISTIREASDLPERTNPEVIFDSIQLREAKKILNIMKIDVPDVPNTFMHKEVKSIFRTLDPATTHRTMVTVLKDTRNLISLSDFVGKLPKSLLAATFSTNIRKKDYSNLLAAIQTPLSEAMKWN